MTASTSTADPAVGTRITLPLSEIAADPDGRPLIAAHVANLATSIKRRGVLQAPTVRRNKAGAWMIALGGHRLAAVRSLGWTELAVAVGRSDGSAGDRAAENMLRQDFTPLEEAWEMRRMLEDGYTVAGVADVVGWTVATVQARLAILTLPDTAQTLIGSGDIPLGAIANLVAIAEKSPALAQAAAGNVLAGKLDGGDLAHNPRAAVIVTTRLPKGAFGEPLWQLTVEQTESLRLGKATAAQIAEAAALHRQLDNTWGSPRFQFSEADVDAARALGVLLELPASGYGHLNAAPIITDKAVYRDLARTTIARTVDELKAALDKQTKRKARDAKRAKGQDGDRRAAADAAHRAALRGFTERAHATNLDLGSALLTRLASVDPTSLDIAQFFCFGLLSSDASYTLVARTLAASGLALVLDEHRTTVTRTLKGGGEGKTRVTYADGDDALAALWAFVEGAEDAAAMFGRTLVVYASQHYAEQLVLPPSRRRSSQVPVSRGDTARDAFERLVAPVLPATHKALQRAIADEAREYIAARDRPASTPAAGGQETAATGEDS